MHYGSQWLGFPAHLLNLIMHLHKRQKAKVKTVGVVSAVMKGVRQGCMLSSHLFNIPLDALMTETLGCTGGLRIGGRTVTMFF